MSTYFYSFSSGILKRCFSSFWTAIHTFFQNVTGLQECTYGMVRTDFKVFPLRKLPTKVRGAAVSLLLVFQYGNAEYKIFQACGMQENRSDDKHGEKFFFL